MLLLDEQYRKKLTICLIYHKKLVLQPLKQNGAIATVNHRQTVLVPRPSSLPNAPSLRLGFTTEGSHDCLERALVDLASAAQRQARADHSAALATPMASPT